MGPEMHPKFEMDGPGPCLALENCSARRLAAALAAAARAPDNYVVVSLGPAAALLCASRAPMYPNLPPPSPDATRAAQTDDDDPPNFEYIGVSRIAVMRSAQRQGHMVALLDRAHKAAALLGRRLAITEVRSERLASVLAARPEWTAVRSGWNGAPEAWAHSGVVAPADVQSATKASAE